MKLIRGAFLILPRLPKNLENHPAIEARYLANTELAFLGQFLITIPKTSVRGPCFVVLPEGPFVIEGNWRPSNVIFHPLFSRKPLTQKRNLSGNWYPLLSYYSDSYHHWLWNDIPRLMTALPHLPPDTRFLIPDNAQDYHFSSLEALGISPDRVLAQSSECETTVEHLWFATPLGDSEWAATVPEVAFDMREKLWAAFAPAKTSSPRRLFVSRQNSRQRRIVNEGELLPIIEQFGFERIFAEEYSFAAQVALFRQADVVLGVHGAGLTNMLHCEAGTKILELHVNNSDVARTHYWMMAEILGHHYSCIVGDMEKNPDQDVDPNLSVNPDDLSRFLSTQLLA